MAGELNFLPLEAVIERRPFTRVVLNCEKNDASLRYMVAGVDGMKGKRQV